MWRKPIVEKVIAFNNTAYMCFVDLMEVFDRVRPTIDYQKEYTPAILHLSEKQLTKKIPKRQE